MQSASEMTPTETLIENAERQRRWLRRAAWAGVAFVVAAILFAVGYPPFIRWQLRQHGWYLTNSSNRGLPDWIPRWADPWFGRIDHVSLGRTPLRIGDLELLQRFPDIDSIVIYSADLSDSALEKLSQLPKLSLVEFHSVRLESVGLRHFATSPNLEHVNFFGTVLDDVALENISACRKLKQLFVTGMTDDNLRQLSRLDRLYNLGLVDPRLTDDGLRRLPGELPSLQLLWIQNAPLSASAIAECARRSKLRTVQLKDVPITDSGLLEFENCSTLQVLQLQTSRVTPTGAEELRKRAPNVHVEILK